MPNRHPAHRRKNMQRYGGAAGKPKLLRRGASDIAEGKQDTECREATPPSLDCPQPRSPKAAAD